MNCRTQSSSRRSTRRVPSSRSSTRYCPHKVDYRSIKLALEYTAKARPERKKKPHQPRSEENACFCGRTPKHFLRARVCHTCSDALLPPSQTGLTDCWGQKEWQLKPVPLILSGQPCETIAHGRNTYGLGFSKPLTVGVSGPVQFKSLGGSEPRLEQRTYR